MIIRIIITLKVVCAFSTLFANDRIPETIKRYNYFINLAEISIVEGVYNEAVMNYEKAFSVEVYPFAVDKYNAAVCFVKLEMYSEAYQLLKEILQKGYHVNHIQNEDVFSDFLLSSWGNKLLDYSHNINIKFDEPLRIILDSLFYMDQKFRRMEMHGNPYEINSDTIDRIDDLNRAELERIIDAYGFPGEEIIGVSDSCLTTQPYWILLTHFQQICSGRRRGEVTCFTDEILNAYIAGRIGAHQASHLLGLNYKDFGSFSGSLFKIIYIPPGGNPSQILAEEKETKEWGFFDLKEDEKEINKVRLDFGLESIEDLRKKLIFRLENETFNFNKISGGENVLTTTNKEQYDYSNGNLIPVK